MRAHGHVNRTGQSEALPATAAVIMAGDDVLPTRLGCRRKKSLIFFHHTNAALAPDDNNVQPQHRGFTPNLCSPTQHDTVQSERKKTRSLQLGIRSTRRGTARRQVTRVDLVTVASTAVAAVRRQP